MVAPDFGDVVSVCAESRGFVVSAAGVVVQPSVLEARRAARAELSVVVDTLISEFDGVFPAGAVIGQVTRSREHLLGLGVRAGLAEATEAMARVRLLELLPSQVHR